MDNSCAQLLLHFYADSFETLQMIWSWFEDVHIFWILASDYFTYCFKLNLVVFRHLLVAISDTLYLVCANSPTIIC